MSKGTRIFPVRLPTDLIDEVRLTIDRRNLWSAAEPWNLSDFIRVCLTREMQKMRRSRRKGKRR
jgi:hypothetical protein